MSRRSSLSWSCLRIGIVAEYLYITFIPVPLDGRPCVWYIWIGSIVHTLHPFDRPSMLLALNISVLVVLKSTNKSSPFFVTFRSIFKVARNTSFVLLCISCQGWASCFILFDRMTIFYCDLHNSWNRSLISLMISWMKSSQYVQNYIWPFLQGCVSSTLDMEWFQTRNSTIRLCPGHESFGYLLGVYIILLIRILTKINFALFQFSSCFRNTLHLHFVLKNCILRYANNSKIDLAENRSRNFNLIIILWDIISTFCVNLVPISGTLSGSLLLLLLLLLHLSATAKGNPGCGSWCRHSLEKYFLSISVNYLEDASRKHKIIHDNSIRLRLSKFRTQIMCCLDCFIQ